MRGQGGRLASRRPGPLEAFGLRPIAAAAPPCRCCLSLVTAAVSRTRDRPRPAPVTRDRPLPVPVTTLLLLLLSAALLNAAHTAAAQMIHAGTLLLLLTDARKSIEKKEKDGQMIPAGTGISEQQQQLPAAHCRHRGRRPHNSPEYQPRAAAAVQRLNS